METLQTVVLPNLDVPGEEKLYVRLNDRAACELARPCVRFADGGECTTDTFYGGLTIRPWKTSAPVQSLYVELAGEGTLLVSFGVHRLRHATRWLDECEVRLRPGEALRLPVRAWDTLQDGMLFLRLRARGAAVLDGVRFCTADPAPNDVRLGLVITHFNRQAQVLPAIERIRRQVLAHPGVRGRITLTVVDNSANLPLADGDGIARLPNRNLGGSGGFARGLLALEDGGRATHALFMDDDASCEADAILRAWALLRYAAAPRLAIAGALVDEAEPWRLLEKGATFDGRCHALHHGRDLRHLEDLLWAERLRMQPDYGGWWFFAFPIAAVERYPFPFFVRGDDVFFSLQNRFDILTMNGIACLGEAFGVKHGPLTAYLDARYHLLHVVLRERGRLRALRSLVSNLFTKPLTAYHYASARAFVLAMRHVAEGPRFFREHLDVADVRAQIARWQPSERLQPIERRGLRLRWPKAARREPGLQRVLRILTLQGFLLPRALLIDRVQLQEKTFHGQAGWSFRYRRVLYEHQPTDTGFIAEYDRRLFFREIRELAGALRVFVRRLPDLHREYREAVPRLASREFWRETYGSAAPARAALTEPPPPAPRRASASIA